MLTNPIDYPIEIRISSTADVNAKDEATDIRGLRDIAGKVEDIFRSIPLAERTRNEWGEENALVSLTIDPDRANLAGITNMDVADSSTAGLSGTTVSVFQEGQKQIPIVARLRMDERAQLSDIQNLYVYGSQDNTKIPLVQISNIDHDLVNGRIVRLEQFRTMNIRSFPAPGHLSSEILKPAMPRLQALQASLPPGYQMQIGGEYDKTKNGFKNLAMVMLVSTAAIYLACYFNSRMRSSRCWCWPPHLTAWWAPSLPYGSWASPLGSWRSWGGQPYRRIVSHSIVLFDFIEERHAEGDDFETGADRRRHPAAASGPDYGRRHGFGAVAAGLARRPPVEAALLCADWRPAGGDRGYQVASARDVCDLCPRLQDSEMGNG